MIISLFVLPDLLYAQEEEDKKLTFKGDFRFRIEEDWSSRKSDGTYRENRTRLRYRGRLGAYYKYNKRVSFGMGFRTGLSNKQQDPQLTLGDGPIEFGTLPFSIEKMYFRYKSDVVEFWLGKNNFPFEKQNELFWSDNVFPEGVFFSATKKIEGSFLSAVSFKASHFVINTSGNSLGRDKYFQGVQLLANMLDKNLKVFPSFYYFNSLPDIPDGLGTYAITYPIFHLGTSYRIKEEPHLKVGADYYHNLADYSQEVLIPVELRDQKDGLVVNFSIGKPEEKGDWTARIVYTYLQRYAAVDFFAQNDWTRWDYSSVGSPDGRLTNFRGLELMLGYMIDKKIKLNTRYFIVQQLIPYGISTETGQRIRFDLDIAF